MRSLIIDLETVGEPFDALDETTKFLMTKQLRKENLPPEEYIARLGDLQLEMGLSALTGITVAFGMLDAETLEGVVYYDTKGQPTEEFTENNIRFIPAGEQTMLAKFWEKIPQYQEIVTFNGYSFDAPFIMQRSAIYRMKPTRNLVSSRFLHHQKGPLKHIDLQDQLTFQGAMRKKGSLHLWCRAFGIPTPKIIGESGDDVARLYREGNYQAIARYNARDIIATKQLYDIWSGFLRFDV